MLNEGTTNAVTLETVLSNENLQAAWLSVKSNAGAPGVDGMTIEQTRDHIKEHWEEIAPKLLRGQYQPAAIRAVEIPKATGGSRVLGIANVQDRLICQGIHQQLTPLWEPVFSEYSYGFRPHRSAHGAVMQANKYIKEGKTWVVDIDLKSFFDEVDWDKLMYLVGKKVKDKKLLRLIGKYLRSPMQRKDGRKQRRRKGLAQGNPLSPLLSNIYLDPLDQELELRGLSFIRYADDIAIFVSSQRAAERILESITKWIEKNLKIPVNHDKSGSGPTDQSALLGFRLYADGQIGIAPKSIQRLKARVRELWEARQNRTSNQLRDQWQEYIQGWWNYFSIANRLWELNDLNGWIRRHIRKCFWLRWKTPRGRINALVRLGVNRRACGIGYTGLGAWRVARSRAMHQGLNNKTLQRYGFTLPWTFAEARE